LLGILEKFAVNICQANSLVKIRKTLEIMMLLSMLFVDVVVASVDVVGMNVGVLVKEYGIRQLGPPLDASLIISVRRLRCTDISFPILAQRSFYSV